jgi:hypothetical protein
MMMVEVVMRGVGICRRVRMGMDRLKEREEKGVMRRCRMMGTRKGARFMRSWRRDQMKSRVIMGVRSGRRGLGRRGRS